MARKRATADSSGYIVLVVDDQEEALTSVRLLLEREGHLILTAASGEEALALFHPGRIHLVIVDYFMPRMSGEELVRALRAQDEDVQILLQTGYSGDKPPRAMLQLLDIQGYHDKSEGPGRLLLWVDVALKAAAHLKKVRETQWEMEESRAQLRRLSARLLHIQEEERERISRELHDHLGQVLTAIGMDVEWVQQHYPRQTTLVQERLGASAQLVQEAIEATRALSATLRPGALSQLGLEAALREAGEEFSRRSGVPVQFTGVVTERSDLSAETALHVYRVVQEALTNVARHARATRVSITLRRSGQALVVSVVDDGKGFTLTPPWAPQSLGLVGMRERAQVVGGELDVRSALGAGTTVTLRVPLRTERREP